MSRCLLATNIFPPHIGGPATYMSLVAQKLADRGHRVTVVCSSDRPADPSDRDRHYRVRRIHASSPYRYHINIRRALLTELLTHPHVLVNGLEAYVYPIARLLRRQYIIKIVGDTVWETARNAGRTSLDIDRFQTDTQAQAQFAALVEARNRPVLYARSVLTPSEYLRRMIVGWGVSAERVSTVPNGVDLTRRGGSAPFPREQGPLEVVFVGRLTNWKGIETLLLSVARLDGIRVTIIGDGPELPHLVELARQLNVNDRVDFLGRQPREEVDARMERSHVLVLTSLYEGLSHTLLEAMAAGLPCIASDRGGNCEVVTSGEDGLLIEPQDVAALSEALRRLRDDESARRRMAQAARRTSARFPIQATVSGVAQMLLAGQQ